VTVNADPDAASYAHYYTAGTQMLALDIEIKCGTGGQYYKNSCDDAERRVSKGAANSGVSWGSHRTPWHPVEDPLGPVSRC
jgi:hypothetical protein